MIRLTVVALLSVFICSELSSQDLHYSQFYNSPLNVNPALTGIFNGDKRLNLSYRNQWNSVEVPWTTFSGSYDMRFYSKKESKGFLSGGILFNYDEQGLSDLKLANFNLLASYTGIMDESNLLTIGGSIGFASRGFNTNSLTWDKQWDGRVFDPNLGSGESFDADRISFLETSIGLNYRWQKDSRTHLNLGVAAFHFIEPSVAFYNADDIKLPMRVSLNGVGSFQLTSKFDIQLSALAQLQDDYHEYLFGGLGKIHVSQQRGKEFELHLGIGYRTNASLYPVMAVQYKNFYGAISYGIDFSDFNDLLNNNPSALELHFNYIITDVRIRKTKVCPIF